MALANYRKVTKIDDVCDIRIENCIDSDEYVWTVIIHGNDYCDGYSPTRREALAKAKEAYKEALAQIGEEEKEEQELRQRQRIGLLRTIHKGGEFGVPASKIASQFRQHLRAMEREEDALIFYAGERWLLTDLGRDTLALHGSKR